MLVATHDGPFHADDVMAVALLRVFVDPDCTVVRTRDPARLDTADVVVDVGGLHDASHGRFDHHQATYVGPHSSAGMVLTWLLATGRIDAELGDGLREGAVDYLDDVDNGRRPADPRVPCFPRIVDALNQPAHTHAEFDAAFLGAVRFAEAWLRGLRAEHDQVVEARRAVREAMAAAVASGSRVIELDRYLPWKAVYFESGGEDHPTDYVLHPGTDGSWRVVAIPPRLGDFGQKRSLPEAWAGLTDEALEAATGVPGSVFCHKNRFIAVFRTREAAVEALRTHGLWS
ncbi:MAG: MYG1 family protein [Alphaproteobacteria bacterium]|nr:MYG1 family protein [Alphaproteobacteria bacterium]